MCWICRTRAVEDRAHAMVCGTCQDNVLAPYAEAWRSLARHLRGCWTETIGRGQFDLTKMYGDASAAVATRVHLHFVQVLASQLQRQGIAVNLESFAKALLTGKAHPEISLLVASSGHAAGSLWSYDAAVSVLRDGALVISALWMHLEHPIAVKICYMKGGAALRSPKDGHPWHPTKQKKIVKLSPYKGDVEPAVVRRDLRI